jgi:hypothetical protein
MKESTKFDVALSFAGEDRAYVEMVAEQLRARGVSVFYDLYEKADLWGKDLYTHLSDVYRTKARYTLMFISSSYREKVWTNHERRAAQSRAIEETGEYILPARFDHTEIPGVLPTVGYIDLRTHSPLDVALLTCEKLGITLSSMKADQVPPPKSPALSGVARFNYSNNNGFFKIGSGKLEFDTRWAKAGRTSIHCYTDSTNLYGLALAPKGIRLTSITSVINFDFTSRVRTPEIGRIVVLQNCNGVYAALQILSIKDDARGDAVDSLEFNYWILEDGSSNFAHVELPN